MWAQVISTGSYLPEQEVVNADLRQFPESAIPLIQTKTGIAARRYAKDGECTSDLAAQAARTCLARANFPAEQVQALILATSSPDRIQPATATRVQHLLGLRRCFAFDINSVCSGALYALEIGNSLLRAGQVENVLVVAAETYSRLLNPDDFSTRPYFGDGAGALLLARSEKGKGVIRSILRTDGSGHDVIQVPAGGSMLPYGKHTSSRQLYFTMRGREVYNFAVEKGAEVIGELLQTAELSTDAVSYVVPHQANIHIIQELSRRTGISFDKFIVNLDRYGNTAAASVLIAFDELRISRQPRPGEVVVLVAFGGGLSWAATAILC